MDMILTTLVVAPVLWLCDLASKLDPDRLWMAIFRDGAPAIARGLALVDTYVVDGAVMGLGKAGVGIARGLGFVDTRVVDGAVGGVSDGTIAAGRVLRRLQTGVTANYALFMIVIGVGIFYAAWWLAR
jgi:hypothetical protein